jgi:hypothetical protein
MFFKRRKQSENWQILRIQISADLSQLHKVGTHRLSAIELGEDLPDRFDGNFSYEINVIPNAQVGDIYWHAYSGKSSTSIHTIVELDYYGGRGLTPNSEYFKDLEIEFWQGSLCISFNNKVVHIAPLDQARSLQKFGYTLHRELAPMEGSIDVPIGYNADFTAVERVAKVNQHVGRYGAIYWNSAIQVCFDIPSTVVHRVNGT